MRLPQQKEGRNTKSSDLLEDLGIDLKCSDLTITWNGPSIPMKERGTLIHPVVTEMLYPNATMAPILSEPRKGRAESWMYSVVDIDKYVAEIAHLRSDQTLSLSKTLQSYRDHFNKDAIH